MKNTIKHILIMLLIIAIGSGCSKTPNPIISSQVDQAFIQDVTLLDVNAKDVSVTKSIPKTVVDATSGNERLDVTGTPLNINVIVKAGTDLTNLYLRCTLSGQSKFATVNPIMGYYTNLSSPKIYTVTSQTGKNVNVYTIKIVTQ